MSRFRNTFTYQAQIEVRSERSAYHYLLASKDAIVKEPVHCQSTALYSKEIEFLLKFKRVNANIALESSFSEVSRRSNVSHGM